jgi:hypothetical protein
MFADSWPYVQIYSAQPVQQTSQILVYKELSFYAGIPAPHMTGEWKVVVIFINSGLFFFLWNPFQMISRFYFVGSIFMGNQIMILFEAKPDKHLQNRIE